MKANKVIRFFFPIKKTTYQVVSRIVQGNKQQQISYTTEISKDDGWTRTYYDVKRTPQVVSPQVDNPYFEVIMLTTKLWSNLKLAIDQAGVITKIVNLAEIQHYWKEDLKFQLTVGYTGNIISQILDQLDQIVMDEEQFIAKLTQDTFFYYWLKHNMGEYVKNPYTGEYKKVGNSNGVYQIETTHQKGLLIKRINATKTTEELERLKKKWKLDAAVVLQYKEEMSGEYNRNSEIVKLSRKEYYTDEEKGYYSTDVVISKIIK